MKLFIKRYNSKWLECKRVKNDGFILPKQLFIDFFNRNEELMMGRMSISPDSIGVELTDTPKLIESYQYLNEVLGLQGRLNNNDDVEYDINFNGML